jgi:hypothetical protein
MEKKYQFDHSDKEVKPFERMGISEARLDEILEKLFPIQNRKGTDAVEDFEEFLNQCEVSVAEALYIGFKWGGRHELMNNPIARMFAALHEE